MYTGIQAQQGRSVPAARQVQRAAEALLAHLELQVLPARAGRLVQLGHVAQKVILDLPGFAGRQGQAAPRGLQVFAGYLAQQAQAV